jgi:hypothetical protein
MSAERDYSHRTLFDKLGVAPESRVALVGTHDDWFLHELAALLDAAPATRLRGAYDLVFLRVDRPQDVSRVATIPARLQPAGGLWILHPKGRGASPSDAEVRIAGIAAGLVDNKISAYSDTHTATRYVIPVNKRPAR